MATAVTITPDSAQVTITPDVERQPTPILDKANELAGKALSGAGLPTSLNDLPNWFRHLTGTHPESEPFWEPIKRAIKEPTQENIVAAVPFIGPTSVSMSKDVQAGKPEDAIATMFGAASAVKGAANVKPGLSSAAKELIDARGVISDIAKATHGHSLTATAIDTILPEQKPIDLKGGAYSDYYGESGKAIPLTKSPNYQKFIESKKAFLADRKAQAAQEADAADAQDLLTRTKKLVTPNEPPTVADLKRAGDLTQVPLQKLQVLAKFGDELAKNEIIRRLKQ